MKAVTPLRGRGVDECRLQEGRLVVGVGRVLPAVGVGRVLPGVEAGRVVEVGRVQLVGEVGRAGEGRRWAVELYGKRYTRERKHFDEIKGT